MAEQREREEEHLIRWINGSGQREGQALSPDLKSIEEDSQEEWGRTLLIG